MLAVKAALNTHTAGDNRVSSYNFCLLMWAIIKSKAKDMDYFVQ